MGSEVRIDGEDGLDDISAGAADAPGVGALAAQRVDAARVWTAAWNPTEQSELVAAGLPARRRGEDEPPTSGERGGVHRSATAGEASEDSSGSGDRPAQRAYGAGAAGTRYRDAAAGTSGPAADMLTLPASVRVSVARGATDLRRS